MNHAVPTACPGYRSQQYGVTLIELMIAMALGVVIIGAVLIVYTSGNNANRNAQAQAQMNEDAQMALETISQELRRAGYNPTLAGGVVNDLGQSGWTLNVCDQGFTTATLTNANVSTLACNASGSNAGIAVVYEGDLYSGTVTGTAPNQQLQDCIGNGVAATVAGGNTYYSMQARLYIKNNALYCRGNGGGNLNQEQVLAENIESLNLRFAIADPAVANSQAVKGYLTATEINAPAPALAGLTPVQRWAKVVAARICIVVVSENVVLQEMKNAAGAQPTYADCNGNSVNIDDGKLRRAYRTTVLLRNHGVGYADS